MNYELPANLQHTAAILQMSMAHHPSEKAPILPAGLFEDLSTRFLAKQPATARAPKVSLLAKLHSLISTPAFGISAAALLILSIALPSLTSPSDTHTLRGTPQPIEASASASIILIGAPAETLSTLQNSGDFEKSAILTADTSSGPRVIVDFHTSTITSISATGETLHTATLPGEKADLPAALAAALSAL